MEADRAIKIIQSLADRIDPLNGERFPFDGQGRRVHRADYLEWDGASYAATNTTRYVWDSMAILAEIRTTALGVSTNYNVWGLDLSGTLHGVGGVGGLLAVHTSPLPLGEGQGEGGTFRVPCYDGNGNVTEVLDGSGSVQAAYEYTPFGQIFAATGPAAQSNPWRFSTKPCDDLWGLILYEFRAYSPDLQIWLSRDPIFEHSWWRRLHVERYEHLHIKTISEMPGYQGGRTVYGFLRNSPPSLVDPLGLKDCKYNAVLGKCVRPKPPPYNPDKFANLKCGGVRWWEDVLEDPAFWIPFFHISCPFTPACVTHDRCYWTCNSTRSECDSQFYLDMLAICHGCWLKKLNSWNPDGAIWLGDCYAIALSYYTGVRVFGNYDFRKYAQPQACEDCCCEGGKK